MCDPTAYVLEQAVAYGDNGATLVGLRFPGGMNPSCTVPSTYMFMDSSQIESDLPEPQIPHLR